MNSIEYINKIRRDYNIPSNFILKTISNYLSKDFLDIKYNKYDLLEKDVILLNKVLIDDFPIEYAINKTNFLGHEFYVDENVLIPRTETEDLVLISERIIKQKEFKNILDLATGSGVIGISLKLRNPSLNVHISDISQKALKVAIKNFQKYNLIINHYKANILEGLEHLIYKIDFFVCNPPYVERKKEFLNSSIRYEPEIALYAGEEGQDFFKEFVKFKDILINKTMIFETTEFNYEKTSRILSELGKIEIIKDSFGKNRFILVKT
ncbi:MAG: HemK/PrmC family methyltransferase [Thermotogota bacterium]